MVRRRVSITIRTREGEALSEVVGPTQQGDGLKRCVEKMKAAGSNSAAIEAFSHYYRLCQQGETGIIPEDSIRPLLDPPRLDSVDVPEQAAHSALAQTVMMRLNGGLGTSMGLEGAKTLLPVREGKNFLDLIVEQVHSMRRSHGVR